MGRRWLRRLVGGLRGCRCICEFFDSGGGKCADGISVINLQMEGSSGSPGPKTSECFLLKMGICANLT